VKDQARRQAVAAQEQHSGELLSDLHDRLERTAPAAARAIDRATQAPTPFEAWHERMRGQGMGSVELLMLSGNDELVRARLDRELPSMQPSEVLALYADALDDPSLQVNATTIGYVERKFGNGWRGAPVEADSEIQAAQQLHDVIGTTRANRVPENARRLDETLARARSLKQLTIDRGVQPRRRQS
jgi:hypothetical protein